MPVLMGIELSDPHQIMYTCVWSVGMDERIVLNLILPITVQIISIDTDPGNS